jgi:1,4-dihydroxy-2-naphthoate octaprenyltransferase
MVGFFASVIGMVAAGAFGVWTLIVLAAVPRLWNVLKFYEKPKPEQAPPGYRGWPLWYVGAAFILTRQAGGLFALGLLVNLFWPIYL